MPAIAVCIPGEPVAKERPRMNRITGNVYTPKNTKAAEEAVGWALKLCGARVDPTSRFGVYLTFRVTNKRWDLDNGIKLVLDAANGIVWKDDSQVDELSVRVERGCAISKTGTDIAIIPIRKGRGT